MSSNVPFFLYCVNKAKTWAIVGGGPSINDCVKDIRRLQRNGANVVSVNKSHDWLLENGIKPWGHVLLDPKEWVADYVKRPRRDVRYFVASQCHESVFESLKDYPVFLWHAGQDFEEDGVQEPTAYLRENWSKGGRDWIVTPGGTTVGLRVPFLGHTMGASDFHMFGMDSSKKDGKLHAYAKPEAHGTKCPDAMLKHNGFKYRFQTNTHMLRQQMDFDKFVEDLPARYASGLIRKDFTMTVHGSGLLPFFAAQIGWHAKPECNADPTKVGGYTNAEPMFMSSMVMAV